MKVAKYVPWIAAALCVAFALSALIPPGLVRGFNLEAAGRLPVLEGGRVKPLDSIARNSLLILSGHQSFIHEGRSVSADEWLLDVMFRPQISEAQPIFVIDDPEVLSLMDLKPSRNRYFSFRTLGPHIEKIEKQASAARPIEAKQRTRFQAAVATLYERIYLYYRLQNTVRLSTSMGLMSELEHLADPRAEEHQQALIELGSFRPLPKPGDGWRNVGEALRAGRNSAIDPGLEPLARLASAYTTQDAEGFNHAVAELTAIISAEQPAALQHAEREQLFNRAEPFYIGMTLYVLALILVFASWLILPQVLRPTAFAILLVAALVHTTGLVSRILLQGRPPVTNLYSSAVFVGWSAVLLGIILERIYRRGFGTAVAAAAGFCSLIIAHHLASDGDTMEMMRAVLDSNFWLATHVVTITIGYSGTFLAGAIAIAYVLRRHLAPNIDAANTKTLVSMAYGVICFSLFFSFVGTVLGGIWADQSWGRFWGWDPKENGALLIVLWNAIILHTRWGGYVREKGLMAMAIFGNVITSLSWFGVNMLGVGLHSYGFMDSAFYTLSAFIASQLVLICFCLLPRGFWKRAPAAAQGLITTAPGVEKQQVG